MAILMMPIFTASLNDLPLSLNRYGTATVNTLRMMAGAVGMAFFVSIMASKSVIHVKDIIQHQKVIDKAHVVLDTATGTAMGINDAFQVATVLTVVGLLLSFFIRNSMAKQNHTAEETITTVEIIKNGQASDLEWKIHTPSGEVSVDHLNLSDNENLPVWYEGRIKHAQTDPDADTVFQNAIRRFQRPVEHNETNSDAAYREAIRHFLGNKLKISESVQAEDNKEPMGVRVTVEHFVPW
jgi:hypothetical protein